MIHRRTLRGNPFRVYIVRFFFDVNVKTEFRLPERHQFISIVNETMIGEEKDYESLGF